jgi:hypothetical protein
MKKLAEVDLDSLRWTRTGQPHSYELRSGEDPVATLHWEHPVETHAIAEAEGIRWVVKRRGFVAPVVSVSDPATGKDLALLHLHLNISLLQVTGGASYRWTRTGFWLPAWEFQEPNGGELVDFEPVREETRLEGGLIEVSPAGRTNPSLLLLLVLGWYFIVQSWIEDDAVSASRAVLDAVSG